MVHLPHTVLNGQTNRIDVVREAHVPIQPDQRDIVVLTAFRRVVLLVHDHLLNANLYRNICTAVLIAVSFLVVGDVMLAETNSTAVEDTSKTHIKHAPNSLSTCQHTYSVNSAGTCLMQWAAVTRYRELISVAAQLS